MKSYLNLKPIIIQGLVFAFLFNSIGVIPAQAQDFVLPLPGKMIALSPSYSPVLLKGIKLDPNNPFRFHFYVDKSSTDVIPANAGIHNQEQLRKESAKLIKYFLASLTTPEKDRIIPQSFGQTEMGRDL